MLFCISYPNQLHPGPTSHSTFIIADVYVRHTCLWWCRCWQTERQNAEDVQLALICSKQKYRMALISLEAISDEVHTQRRLRQQRLVLPLRTPGVGAEHELDDELFDMPSASLGQCSLITQLNCHIVFTPSVLWLLSQILTDFDNSLRSLYLT